uniref:AlNc14C23G2386 protein n=1 Tax=Albugo laibachii Nc14 TaxID=890382 RepID=F0W687_9STRA|nr:AlNc14C23G2386 [Albugo laibachii Nc14]|eukprot:CCA16629.1 AlNc14C23G2386 [Albugo laibachii Nc14]
MKIERFHLTICLNLNKYRVRADFRKVAGTRGTTAGFCLYFRSSHFQHCAVAFHQLGHLGLQDILMAPWYFLQLLFKNSPFSH